MPIGHTLYLNQMLQLSLGLQKNVKKNIRFMTKNKERLYLIDDIINVLNKASTIFDDYIAFNEACDQYSYHLISLLLSEYMCTSYTDEKLTLYDVVLSDTRYKYQFRPSVSFLKRESLHDAYNKWFHKYAPQMFSICNIHVNYDIHAECTYDDYYSNTSKSKSPMYEMTLNDNVYFNQNFYNNQYRKSYYEYDPEYEELDLLCLIWDMDKFIGSEKFINVLKHNNLRYKTDSFDLYDITGFRNSFCVAIYNKLIEDYKHDRYIITSIVDDLSFYFE